jgi:hypothetical protein
MGWFGVFKLGLNPGGTVPVNTGGRDKLAYRNPEVSRARGPSVIANAKIRVNDE